MPPLPTIVAQFFQLYPDAAAAYQTYTGSVYGSEEAALKSVYGHANKKITVFKNPASQKGKKKD